MQQALGDELAAADVLVFGQGLVILPGDDRGIVLAGNRDGHLMQAAIGAGHGEGVCHLLAVLERLYLVLAVVELIAPLAIVQQREAAISTGGIALRHEVRFAVIGIRDGQSASGRLC